MTALDDVCDDLAAWLPAAHGLLADPDADGTTGTGTSTGSAAPWNSAAANAYFDAHALVRDVERLFRHIVTGSSGTDRSWSAGSTLKALRAIGSLAAAVPRDTEQRAARDLHAAVTAILQLAAVDEAERPQRVQAPCPYCGYGMLRVFPRSGRVACLRAGACEDGDGNVPTGTIGQSQIDGTPRVTWADGLVT